MKSRKFSTLALCCLFQKTKQALEARISQDNPGGGSKGGLLKFTGQVFILEFNLVWILMMSALIEIDFVLIMSSLSILTRMT